MYRSSVVANNPGPAQFYLQSVLEPDMANVGWVKVSSNITVNSANATNAWNWDVMYSPNNINQIGKDWFIALGYDTATNANIVVSIFEQWNGSNGGLTTAGGNLCVGYPPGTTQNAAGTSYPIQSNGWCNVNPSTLPLSPNSNAAYLISGWASVPNSNQLSTFMFTYFQSVTIDRVIFATSNVSQVNTGPAYYLGTYDSFMSNTQDPYPIVALNFNTQITTPISLNGPVGSAAIAPNAIHGMATREPALVNLPVVGNWCAGVAGGLNEPIGWFGTVNTPDFYSNKYIFNRAAIFGNHTTNGAGMRGLLKDIYVTNAIALRGDTVGINVNGVAVTVVWLTNNFTNGLHTNGSTVGLGPLLVTMAQV